MTAELIMLFWAVVLAFVQVLVAVILCSKQAGLAELAGNRDTFVPEGIAGRATRAHRNMLENLPLFAALVLIVHVAGLSSDASVLGAQIFVIARLAAAIIYIIGIPWLRTAAFGISVVGLVMVSWPIWPLSCG